MKSLSEKLHRMGRRFSDPDSPLATSISERSASSHAPESDSTSPIRLRTSSHSLIPADSPLRARSRSISKRDTKALIRQETAHVIQRKLLHVLDDLGLQLPIPLATTTASYHSAASKIIHISVANTHDCIFLPPASSTSLTYEDAEMGGNIVPETQDLEDSAVPSASDSSVSLSSLASESASRSSTSVQSLAAPSSGDALKTMQRKMRAFHSPNYLSSQIDSTTPIPHLFAIIVELKKETSLKTIQVELTTAVRTTWPNTSNGTRNQQERFKIGDMEWSLNFSDADYYLNTKNTNDTWVKGTDPRILAARTRNYRLRDLSSLSQQSSAISLAHVPSSHSTNSDGSTSTQTSSSQDIQKMGLYVFLLPVIFPAHIPATVTSPSAVLNHKLSIKVPEVNEKLNKKAAVKANYTLPMVRTPPSSANSVTDKPIYVNRTWNDALHYSITFPRKYVSLGSEHTINIKLVPLVKEIVIKRIKFNILERTTFVSSGTDADIESEESGSKSRNTKTKERVIPLCELKTKAKSNMTGVEPFKEEVINCPDNNLLFKCYEKPSNVRDKDAVMVASPLDISIALPFLTSKADKEMLSSSVSEMETDARHKSISRPRGQSFSRKESIASLESPSSPIIGTLETHISHSTGVTRESIDEDVLRLDSTSLSRNGNGKFDSIYKGYTTSLRALSPDSNFRHIQISHRLQVSFRISKPDPADDNKMHHYEVVVDTPIVLLSAKCNDESIQLPKYDEIETEVAPVVQPAVQPAVQPSPPTRGVVFRTPSYVGNGVTIKPLDNFVDDNLPSFEQAVSDSAEPVMRSASIVSVDSNVPAEPAPAYDQGPTNYDLGGSYNIDHMLHAEPVIGHRKNSGIRASLQNSFAPVSMDSGSSVSDRNMPSTSTNDSSGTDLSTNESVSDGASSHTSAGEVNLNIEQPAAKSRESSPESEFDPEDPISRAVPEEPQDEESILYVDEAPLLQNESLDDLTPSNGGLKTHFDDYSSATLDEAQSLFHTYA